MKTRSWPLLVCTSAASFEGSCKWAMVSMRKLTLVRLLKSAAISFKRSSEAGTKWFQVIMLTSRLCAKTSAWRTARRPNKPAVAVVAMNRRRVSRFAWESSLSTPLLMVTLPVEEHHFAALSPTLSQLRSSEPGIGQIADPIAEAIETQSREHKGHARKCGNPPRTQEILATIAQHTPPTGGWGLNPESEEAQRRF